MKFIPVVAILLGSVLAAQAPPGTEHIETLAGSKVSIHLADGSEVKGRISHVLEGSVLLEPLHTGHGSGTTLSITDIRTIRRLRFHDSLTGKILRTSGIVAVGVPGMAIESPFIVLEFALIGGYWLVTGRWPNSP